MYLLDCIRTNVLRVCVPQNLIAACLPLTFVAAALPAAAADAFPSVDGTPALSEYHRHMNRHRPGWRRAVTHGIEELAIVLRGAYLLALFTPLVLTAPLAFYLGWGRASWMELLRWTLERAGPAFIKWGAWRLPGDAVSLHAC